MRHRWELMQQQVQQPVDRRAPGPPTSPLATAEEDLMEQERGNMEQEVGGEEGGLWET